MLWRNLNKKLSVLRGKTLSYKVVAKKMFRKILWEKKNKLGQHFPSLHPSQSSSRVPTAAAWRREWRRKRDCRRLLPLCRWWSSVGSVAEERKGERRGKKWEEREWQNTTGRRNRRTNGGGSARGRSEGHGGWARRRTFLVLEIDRADKNVRSTVQLALGFQSWSS